MELGLYQQQTMKLAMTQELRQAITILQYSGQELVEFIQEQALENPLIDVEETDREEREEPPPSFDRLSYGTSTYKGNEEYDPFDFIKDDKKDHLKEDLLQQARYLNLGETKYKRLEYMILLLDEDGYLPENIVLETAVEWRRPSEEIDEILSILQTLEPAGIGARHLKECLLLQLGRFAPEDEQAREIIAQHLPQVAEKNWQALAHELDVCVEDILEAVAVIQELQPKPGSVYNTEPPRFIRPDLSIQKSENGYRVILHDDFVPTIHVNHQYDAFLSKKTKSEASRYIHDKYKQTMWLINSIEQRRVTLRRVTKSIASKQRMFLEQGPHFLAPLTLKEVADELDIHESTVSRAARQKNVQTPHGLYELKSFFTSRVSTASGQGLSSTSAKLFIKDMVKNEDATKPLSDQKIVETLKTTQGIALSRRTVAKYREALHIPSSAKRKKYAI